MAEANDQNNGEEEKTSYETTPEKATGFGEKSEKATTFNRKKVLTFICTGFAVVICGGLLFNVNSGKSENAQEASRTTAARTPTNLLQTQLDRSLSSSQAARDSEGEAPEAAPLETEAPFPEIVWNTEPVSPPEPARVPVPVQARQSSPVPAREGASAPQRAEAPEALPSYYTSPLTPRMEGSLFSSSPLENNGGGVNPAALSSPQGFAPQTLAEQYTEFLAANQAYTAGNSQNQNGEQSPQSNREAFYGGGNTEAGTGGFIGANSIWIGTVIPGILNTSINTDLPGNVIARVTQNIYDSQTGKNLLIPQGTILMARYNSSVSYAQRRVQIAWDSLIRPDGFQLDLGGMFSVDKDGLSGQEAIYHENWFEYLKAAGIITMFTVANSRLAEEAGNYTSEEVSGSIAQANASFVGETGSNVVSRAMDIQPTLTVESGTVINILLNTNLFLPSLNDYEVSQKYVLE